MRRLSVRLTLAGTAALSTAAVLSPTPANAEVGYACTSVYDGTTLVAKVCTTARGEQAGGSLNPYSGTVTANSMKLSRCNGTGTTCTVIAETTTLTTADVPALPGRFYQTCADFSVWNISMGTRAYH